MENNEARQEAESILKQIIPNGVINFSSYKEEKDKIIICMEKMTEWQRDQMKEQIEKLQSFKDYVHDRLDKMGIEKDPESEHKAAGCRIGGRLDIIERDYIPRKKVVEEIQKRMWAIEKDINDNNFLEARQAHTELESLKQTIQNYGKDQNLI